MTCRHCANALVRSGSFAPCCKMKENRSLSVVELCRRAGYTSSTKPWFRALKDEDFREHLISIGVPVWRRTEKQSPPGLVPLADPDEVWRSDTVDLRRLTHDYPKHVR